MPEASAGASPAVAEAGAADERPVQKNTSRCFTCKKKVRPSRRPFGSVLAF